MKKIKSIVIVLIPILTGFGGFLFGKYVEQLNTDLAVKEAKQESKSCDVPHSFCDGAIKGLEEELSIAFNKIDTYEEIINTKDCLKQLKETEKIVSELQAKMAFLRELSVTALQTVDMCSEKLNICVIDTNKCMLKLNYCNKDHAIRECPSRNYND